MALETFTPPVQPSPGTSKKITPKILKAEFGDGYSQSSRNGHNHIRDEVSLSWDYLLRSEAEAIDAFFTARGGDQAFWYQPFLYQAPLKWTCETWDVKVAENGGWQVSATLIRNFTLET